VHYRRQSVRGVGRRCLRERLADNAARRAALIGERNDPIAAIPHLAYRDAKLRGRRNCAAVM
jgi:hypothetical protein